MEELLQKTGESTCRNCGLPITELTGEWSPAHWSHLVGGRYEAHCPGSPVAEPTDGIDQLPEEGD